MRPGQVSDQTDNHAVMLQQPLQAGVPCSGKVAVRQMSSRLGQTLLEAGTRSLPDMATVRALLLKTDSGHVKLMVNLLFMVMQSLARDWAEQSSEYFLLLTRLLSYLSSSGVVLSNCSAVLTKQIDTLTMGREAVLRTGHTATPGVGASG